MRTTFAVLLAGLLLVMTTADGLVCPDGCADDAPAQSAAPHPSPSCAFCHGWSASPIVVPSRPAPRPIARVTAVALNPSAPALPTIERPPKVA